MKIELCNNTLLSTDNNVFIFFRPYYLLKIICFQLKTAKHSRYIIHFLVQLKVRNTIQNLSKGCSTISVGPSSKNMHVVLVMMTKQTCKKMVKVQKLNPTNHNNCNPRVSN